MPDFSEVPGFDPSADGDGDYREGGLFLSQKNATLVVMPEAADLMDPCAPRSMFILA